MKIEELKDLESCRCGRVYNLEKLKDDKFDFNDITHKVKCPSCGCLLWD